MESQKAERRQEEDWSFLLGLPGSSWGSLGLVPSLGLLGSLGLPGSLCSLESGEVGGSTGTLPGAFQKVFGPPERGCKGASIRRASIRGFY